jgi:hypothetical protein
VNDFSVSTQLAAAAAAAPPFKGCAVGKFLHKKEFMYTE